MQIGWRCDRLDVARVTAAADCEQAQVTICRTALPLLAVRCPHAALAQDSDAAGRRPSERRRGRVQRRPARSMTAMPTSSPPAGDVRMNREGNRSARRQRDLEPASAARSAPKAMSASSTRRATSLMATASCSTTRCATAWSRICCSCSRTAAGWPRSRRDAQDGYTTLYHAAYTPCAVVDDERLPAGPDLADHRGQRRPRSGPQPHQLPGREPQPVRHADHRPARPVASRRQPGRRQRPARARHPRSAAATASSSALPYYFQLAPNRDATITPHVYHRGAADARRPNIAQLTSARRLPGRRLRHLWLAHADRSRGGADRGPRRRAPRLYRGQWPVPARPAWSVTASGRYVTDRTFLRRYDISRDDRLRSVVDAERISADSYISIAGWAFQGLRVDRRRRPAADRPARDRRALADRRSRSGTARSSCRPTASRSSRTEGQDTQRAFAGARWDRRTHHRARARSWC